MNVRRQTAVLFLLLIGTPVSARTIALTAEDCDQMAVISSLAPRLSWAIHAYNDGLYNTAVYFYWHADKTVLMRFPIAELIPKNQRITRAEYTIAPYYAANAEIHIRRILAEWGNGVCHQYRMVHPKKVAWSQPGGRGPATDRANKDTAVIKVVLGKPGDYTADVTEDIELWYTGAAANRGWIMSQENPAGSAYLPPPYGLNPDNTRTWKLRITFEPR